MTFDDQVGFPKQVTRRGFNLLLGAASAFASWGSVAAATPTKRPSLLKSLVSGPTWNVHVHISDEDWWVGDRTQRVAFDRGQALKRLGKYGFAESPEETNRYVDRLERLYASRSLEQRARFLIDELDEAGIDHAVHLVADQSFMPGGGGRQYRITMDQVLEEAAALRAKFPGRLVTFAGINPARGADGVALLERAVKQYGCVGMGEWVNHQWNIPADNKEICYPYLKKCIDLGIPMTSNSTSAHPTMAPEVFDRIATDFPALKINLGGAGYQPPRDVQRGIAHPDWPAKILAVAAKHKNVYLEFDDWQGRDPDRLQAYFVNLRAAMDSEARTRVMFGSDSPVLADMYSEGDWIDVTLKGSDSPEIKFTREEINMIFSKNPANFLRRS